MQFYFAPMEGVTGYVFRQAQFALFGYTLYHVLTHKNYKHGNRALWLVITIVLMNFVGPILYFIFGKEDA